MSAWKLRASVAAFFTLASLFYLDFQKDERELLRRKRALTEKPDGVFGTPCGQRLTDSEGFVASPGFPYQQYPPMSDCSYHISAPEGKGVRIEFLYMDLEEAPLQKNSDCSQDSVTIVDDNKPTKFLGGQRFCGRDTFFQDVFSRTSNVTITFLSDDYVHYEGFVLRYSFVDVPEKTINCNFEEQQGLCPGWFNLRLGNFNWLLHDGPTPSGPVTGPDADHTYGNSSGTYMYFESSGAFGGQTAMIRTARGIIPVNETYCFEFWYHMKGKGVGSLEVRQMSKNTPRVYQAPTIAYFKDHQSHDWLPYYRNISGSNTTATSFAFIATRGSGYDGDIAVDDVGFHPRPCPTYVPAHKQDPNQPQTTTTPKPTTLKPTTPEPTTTPLQTTSVSPPPRQSKCKENQYECKAVGNCIENDWLCDGLKDCLHNDDETNCTSTEQKCESEWKPWTEWRPCSQSCGSGSRYLTRKCQGGEPGSCGCQGVTLIEEECNTQPCVTQWMEWSSWSDCSVTCGGGFISRKRNCTDPTPGACPGLSEEKESCIRPRCPVWTTWGNWSPCFRFCDSGIKTRSRTCDFGTIPECKLGSGEEATEQSNCTGRMMDTIACSGPGNEWGEWSECTATCGGGSRARSRLCKMYFANNVCSENVTVSEPCNAQECPRVQCGDELGIELPPVMHAECSDADYAGSTCTLKCEGGYQHIGAKSTTCGSDGMWSLNNSPKCKNICPPRNNKLVNYQKRTCPMSCRSDKDCGEGERCNCDAACGRTCSKPETTCTSTIFRNNLKSLRCTQGYSVGSYCQVGCEQGFKLAGVSMLSCQSDGRWDRRFLPVCRAITSETQCRLRRSRHDKCCGVRSYDSKRQFCCRGVVLYKSFVANDCCAGKPFNSKNAICCSGRVYNKRLMGCCGGKPYRTGWNPRCCGESLYDIYNNYCDASETIKPLEFVYSWDDEEEEEEE